MRPRYLTAAIAALVLTTTSGLIGASYAQASPQAGPGQAGQWRFPQGSRRESLAKPRMNFTEAQRQQFQAIRQRTREQINAVLTPQQRAQIESRKRGEPINLNLTEAQQSQIHAIRVQARQEMDALLTPEQRRLRDEMWQNWEENRGQPGMGPGMGRGMGRGGMGLGGMGPGTASPNGR